MSFQQHFTLWTKIVFTCRKHYIHKVNWENLHLRVERSTFSSLGKFSSVWLVFFWREERKVFRLFQYKLFIHYLIEKLYCLQFNFPPIEAILQWLAFFAQRSLSNGQLGFLWCWSETISYAKLWYSSDRFYRFAARSFVWKLISHGITWKSLLWEC